MTGCYIAARSFTFGRFAIDADDNLAQKVGASIAL
jgi:hypothetical protein